MLLLALLHATLIAIQTLAAPVPTALGDSTGDTHVNQYMRVLIK
jgi:hypothetical protein